MTELLILADDMTGALDSGVQLMNCGATVVSGGFDPGLESPVQVVCLSCRHDDEKTAYEKVFATAAGALDSGVKHLYLKMDSTLRGPIGAMLGALSDACGKQAVFAPAYPKLGRTTVNGVHLVNGVPVTETAFAKDSLNPVKTAVLAEIAGDKALCFNAESDGDLLQAAIFAAQRDLPMCGCAGLAGALTEALKLERHEPSTLTPKLPFLILCGSINDASMEQTEWARLQGISTLTLQPHELLNGPSAPLDFTDNLIVRTASGPAGIEAAKAFAASQGLATNEIAEAVARTMGCIAADAYEKGVRSFAVFGGDTLLGVLKALDFRSLTPIGTVAEGVVISEAQLPTGKALLISKAGGFGRKEIIQDILKKQ